MIVSRIERSLTNIYLIISDDFDVNEDRINPIFKRSVLAVASEFLGSTERCRSGLKHASSELAHLDMAIDLISMGKGTSISSKERDQLVYWFGRVKDEYADRRAMSPINMNAGSSVQMV